MKNQDGGRGGGADVVCLTFDGTIACISTMISKVGSRSRGKKVAMLLPKLNIG